MSDFDLLMRGAQVDTVSVWRAADGTLIVENPLGLTQINFSPKQWARMEAMMNQPFSPIETITENPEGGGSDAAS